MDAIFARRFFIVNRNFETSKFMANVKQLASAALTEGNGVFRLAPNWIPRSFLHPSRLSRCDTLVRTLSLVLRMLAFTGVAKVFFHSINFQTSP